MGSSKIREAPPSRSERREGSVTPKDWFVARYSECADRGRRFIGTLSDLGGSGSSIASALGDLGWTLGFDSLRVGRFAGLAMARFASREEAQAAIDFNKSGGGDLSDVAVHAEQLQWEAVWFTHRDRSTRRLYEGASYDAACLACMRITLPEIYETGWVKCIACGDDASVSAGQWGAS